MKCRSREASPLYPTILFRFTDHPITVWAGMILLRVYFEWVGLRKELGEVLGEWVKRSNNQISNVEVMLSWFYGLALGAKRFEHFTRYRRDPMMGMLLGIARFPSPDTVRRLFLSFNYRRVTQVTERLMRFSLNKTRPILLGHTLDLDSTVFCRYGEKQEGSLKGYNPKKPGRPSHHPLVGFLSEARRVLWATLRSGNSRSANGCVEFLRQGLSVLPAEHRVALVRADAGFFEKRFLEFLEDRELPYIIVAKLSPIVRRVVLHSIARENWRPIGPGIEVATVEVSFPSWQAKSRRFVCLRQQLSERPKARGKLLFDFPGYTYRVVVTNLTYSAEIITRMYTGRAESENRIKELKEDLGLDGFCLKSFDATDAAFRTGCVLYNFLAGFRETVLPRSWFERRLRALREFVFLVGADLICQGRKVKVRLALPKLDRPEFLRRLRTVSEGLPIAAQLEWSTRNDDPINPDALIPRLSGHAPQTTPDLSP
jgi:hypothetical protein